MVKRNYLAFLYAQTLNYLYKKLTYKSNDKLKVVAFSPRLPLSPNLLLFTSIVTHNKSLLFYIFLTYLLHLLLLFFVLDTLIHFFTVHGDILRSINSQPHLI